MTFRFYFKLNFCSALRNIRYAYAVRESTQLLNTNLEAVVATEAKKGKSYEVATNDSEDGDD